MEMVDIDPILSIPEFAEIESPKYQSIGDIVRAKMDIDTTVPPEEPETPKSDDRPQYQHPLWNPTELDELKTEAIRMRDSLVECVNNITNYRLLMNIYIPIPRSFLNDIETLKLLCNVEERGDTEELVLRNIDIFNSIPSTFAFVMALKDSTCRFMSDEYILSYFFGENALEWIYYPASICKYEASKQLHIFIHYECMAYIIVNFTDELVFDIKDCLRM